MKDVNVTNQIVSVGRIITQAIKADLAGSEFSLPADVDFNKLYNLCEMHRVTPIIAGFVLKSNAPEDIKTKFKKELFKVSMRYETQMKEKKELSEEFTNNNIDH